MMTPVTTCPPRRLLPSPPGLVVHEFHCAVALRRKMHWARVNMWPSELPDASTVVLSGRDNLVPVKEVMAGGLVWAVRACVQAGAAAHAGHMHTAARAACRMRAPCICHAVHHVEVLTRGHIMYREGAVALWGAPAPAGQAALSTGPVGH